jgi:predicted DNA-binding transcriptional regulator YafY
VNPELICDAIKRRRVITFSYKSALRTVEPHLLGYDKKNNLALSAWQLSGGSGQSWRSFHLSLLTNVSITDDEFPWARPDYNPNDQTMSRILCRL